MFPALDKLSEKTVRGKHKHTHGLVDILREQSGYLYTFFSFWFRRPSRKWPPCLRKLIEKVERERPDFLCFVRDNGKYRALEITALCVEWTHREIIEKYGLRKPTESTDNFYETYIQDAKKIIKKVTAKRLRQPANNPPLLNLLKALKIT